MTEENIYHTTCWVSFNLMDKVVLLPMNFSTGLFRIKVNLWLCAVQPLNDARTVALFWKQRLSELMSATSCLWFQIKAAPELWMVVSSGWGFLGKRRGCWHRLSGAEGSPHRVPVGIPAKRVEDTQHNKLSIGEDECNTRAFNLFITLFNQ